jgi:hypothetical protein
MLPHPSGYGKGNIAKGSLRQLALVTSVRERIEAAMRGAVVVCVGSGPSLTMAQWRSCAFTIVSWW